MRQWSDNVGFYFGIDRSPDKIAVQAAAEISRSFLLCKNHVDQCIQFAIHPGLVIGGWLNYGTVETGTECFRLKIMALRVTATCRDTGVRVLVFIPVGMVESGQDPGRLNDVVFGVIGVITRPGRRACTDRMQFKELPGVIFIGVVDKVLVIVDVFQHTVVYHHFGHQGFEISQTSPTQ